MEAGIWEVHGHLWLQKKFQATGLRDPVSEQQSRKQTIRKKNLKKQQQKKKQSKEKIEIGFVISNVSVPIKESKVILPFLPFLF